MSFSLGLEQLLSNKKILKTLKTKRVGLVCHPASVNKNLEHSFDLLKKHLNLTAAFGPQHGIKGEKQDNMIESDTYIHPSYKIPIYSLYGEVRRPTAEMMKSFDVMIFDLQDLGCRIYTFVTTLLYAMEECAKFHKPLYILDRPNPAGREIEGFLLEKGWESFVGAAEIPMRHGLTVGELAIFFKQHFSLDLELHIVKMKSYSPNKKSEYGWPGSRAWVNPSPNAQTINMARCYAGTVLIEGTTLSEGRGTTRALELMGAPDLDYAKIIAEMKRIAPQWMKGAMFRECYFEPTFHKHQKQLCHGLQMHTDFSEYKPKLFKPFRATALMLKAIANLYPSYEIYRKFDYEYTFGKLAFDVINGGPKLRQWIDNSKASAKDLETSLRHDEKKWMSVAKKYYLY